MRKKLTALFLTFCLALTPFASAFAANGEGGTTPDLVISTAEKLAEFAEEVNNGTSYQGKLVVLGASINLAGVNWTPIGTESSPFKGTFDGEGFTVSNVTVNKADLEYAGLFGRMEGAEIKDLTVKNVSIQAKSYAGGLIGDAFTGTVSNCHVTGEIQIKANYKVGGLAGNGYASFYDCSVTGADDSTVEAVYKEADLEGDSAGASMRKVNQR